MAKHQPGDQVYHDHPTLADKKLTVNEVCPGNESLVNCRYSVPPYTATVDRKARRYEEFDYRLTTWLKRDELHKDESVDKLEDV